MEPLICSFGSNHAGVDRRTGHALRIMIIVRIWDAVSIRIVNPRLHKLRQGQIEARAYRLVADEVQGCQAGDEPPQGGIVAGAYELEESRPGVTAPSVDVDNHQAALVPGMMATVAGDGNQLD